MDKIKVQNQLEECLTTIKGLQNKFSELQKLIYQPETMELNIFNSVIWKNKLTEMIEKTPIMQCVKFDKFLSGNIRQQGDTIRILNSEKENLCITQKKFFAFKVDDTAKVQTNSDLLEAHLSNSRRNIEEVITEYIFKKANENVKNIIEKKQLNKNNIYGYFVELAISLKDSLKELDYEKQRPFVIINPVIESYLLQNKEFISAYNINDNRLRENAIGRIAGMDIIVTNFLPEIDNKFHILAGVNNAILFVANLVKIESLRDKDTFADLIRGLYLYEVNINNPKWLAKLVIEK